MAGSIIPLRFNSRFRLSWSSWDSPLPAVLNRPPRVAIPGFDASPPTLVWQTYNMQTKERGEIAKDGQSLEVPSGEQYVVTPAVEDLNNGVKDVILSGDVHFTCAQGGQVENKKFPLETQETKPVPDQEN